MAQRRPTTEVVKKDESKALAPIDSIRKRLEVSKVELARALPDYLKPEQFIRIALTEFQRTPRLLDCTPRSLVGALFQSAQLGLTIDSTLGWAYLVPYGTVATLIPGYKGFIKLAYNSGLVDTIAAQVVRQGDEFDFSEGTKPFLHHKRKLITKWPEDELAGVIAAYAVAKIKGTEQAQFVVMERAAIEKRALRSRAYQKKEGPWVTDPVSMFRKTPVRDLFKWLPSATEQMQTAVALDEKAEAGVNQRLDVLAPAGVFDTDEEMSSLDRLGAVLPDPEEGRQPGDD